MSEEETLPPMDGALRDLLRDNAPSLVAPPGVEARLYARLGTSIPGLGDPPPGGGGGAAPAPGGVALSTGVKAAIGIALGSAVLVGVAAFGTGGKTDTVTVRAPVITTISASTPASTNTTGTSASDVPTMNVESLP